MPDMRALLELAKDDAPAAGLDVDDIVAAGRRRKRWAIAQRIGGAGVVAAAAAVTAAVLVVSQGATGTGGTGTQVGSPPKAEVPVVAKPAPPFTFTFDGYTAGTYRVIEPHTVTATTQSASVVGPGQDADGKPIARVFATMTVHQPGTYDVAGVRTGTKLTVLGRDAYQTTASAEVISSFTRPSQVESTPTTVDVLAWQYADDAWALITDEPSRDGAMPIADKVAVAELLRPEIQVTARLPFRVGYLPTGWTLQSVSGRSFTAEDTGLVHATYAAPNADPASASATVPAVTISIGQVDNPPPDAPANKETCIAGQYTCTWQIPGTGYYLAVNDPAKTLPDAELLRIGQSLTFADFAKPDTWTPVA